VTAARDTASTERVSAQDADRLDEAGHRRLLTQLSSEKTDRRRYTVMKRFNKRYALSTAQKRAIVRTFESAEYRRAAETTMSLPARSFAVSE
jgi:hypothetical protein